MFLLVLQQIANLGQKLGFGGKFFRCWCRFRFLVQAADQLYRHEEQTRMLGGVGSAGKMPALTRLGLLSFGACFDYRPNLYLVVAQSLRLFPIYNI